METSATAKYVKVGSQKARLVIDQIRGKNVHDAMTILTLSDKSISDDITKLLKSAVANAENNNELDVDNLYVKSAYANQGPTQKRMRARAMGRGNRILKRSSHLTIVLAEKE